jgi:hypothetical protein
MVATRWSIVEELEVQLASYLNNGALLLSTCIFKTKYLAYSRHHKGDLGGCYVHQIADWELHIAWRMMTFLRLTRCKSVGPIPL